MLQLRLNRSVFLSHDPKPDAIDCHQLQVRAQASLHACYDNLDRTKSKEACEALWADHISLRWEVAQDKRCSARLRSVRFFTAAIDL